MTYFVDFTSVSFLKKLCLKNEMRYYQEVP
jgi:hypothetical protein